MAEKPKRVKRLVVYISEDQHRKLRSKLALTGLTVSEWFRQQVDKFLGNDS